MPDRGVPLGGRASVEPRLRRGSWEGRKRGDLKIADNAARAEGAGEREEGQEKKNKARFLLVLPRSRRVSGPSHRGVLGASCIEENY